MIYCERCGVANREGSAFCNACAASLSAQDAAGEEPLPGWLRQAAVGTYLWKGAALLPEWLSTLRPFRELYGKHAVILPPPASAVAAAPHAEPPFEYPGDDEVVFAEIPDDEAGALESDVLVIEDDLVETPSREHESPPPLHVGADEPISRAEAGEYAPPASAGETKEDAATTLLGPNAPETEDANQLRNSDMPVPTPPPPSMPLDAGAEFAHPPVSPQAGAGSRAAGERSIHSAHTVETDEEGALLPPAFVPAEPALEAPLQAPVRGWAVEEQHGARQASDPADREGVGGSHVAADDAGDNIAGARLAHQWLPARDEEAVGEAAARLRADVEFVLDPRNESTGGERGGRR